MERRRIWQTMAGIMVIALGVMILGLQTGWWSAVTIRTIGPVFMIVVGSALVIMGHKHGEPGGGVALVGGGVVLLLHTSGTLPFSTSWPLLIVAGGISLLVGHRRSGGCARKDPDHVA